VCGGYVQVTLEPVYNLCYALLQMAFSALPVLTYKTYAALRFLKNTIFAVA